MEIANPSHLSAQAVHRTPVLRSAAFLLFGGLRSISPTDWCCRGGWIATRTGVRAGSNQGKAGDQQQNRNSEDSFH